MGDNTIHYMGHVKMMGTTQPFISGAISKTVNLPEESTPEDIAERIGEPSVSDVVPLAPRRGRFVFSVPQLAAINLGLGRAAYEAAVDYSKIRRQGGRNIIEHQAIGTKLAEILHEVVGERIVVVDDEDHVRP